MLFLRGTRLVLFLTETNGLESWGTDVGNVCLEAFTKEKVLTVAGPEVENLECHNLIITKALHRLRTSVLLWNETLADCPRGMGFEPCKMEPDIWFRPHGEDHYECINIYVYDLLIMSKYPKSTIDFLTNEHSFKLKGTGPISYHLGCEFGRDDDGALHFAPKKVYRDND